MKWTSVAVKGRLLQIGMVFSYVCLHQVGLHHSAILLYVQKLGLMWCFIQKQNIGAYRMDSLGEFLISLDNLYKNWNGDPEKSQNTLSLQVKVTFIKTILLPTATSPKVWLSKKELKGLESNHTTLYKFFWTCM
jgi:hypothetical protein